MKVRPASRVSRGLALAVLVLASSAPALAQWVSFNDETATRLVADPALGSLDTEEKDYAWGDVDKDGDIDLVVVRKEIGTSAGKRTNVLFLNEGGVLVDRTSEFASEANVPGDLGFLTPTNDRDVALADVNRDGWLDIVTATTISDGDPKEIGHPRIYINLGEDGTGNWLGFRYESQRIPTMLSYNGEAGHNPRFCALAAGDLTQDGFPELYFSDYDSGAFGPPQLLNADFNDRLLLNDGTGNFIDATRGRLLGLVPAVGERFEVSAFGAAAAIADMNGDSFPDIVKQTALTSPIYVGIAYNDAPGIGFFDTFDVVNQLAPYFFSVGDLNNDGRLDLVISDDGADRYMLNQGNGSDGMADFLSYVFSFDSRGDDGFAGNSVIADLNDDGWNDVLVAGQDVDVPGCGLAMHIYRNLGGVAGDQIVLQEQTSGSECSPFNDSPNCLVAGIPSNKLLGVHDIAVFDIDGDNRKDLVVGRCSGTEIYINDATTRLTFGFPQGLPVFVPPAEPWVFQVQVGPFGTAVPQADTGQMFASVNGALFQPASSVDLGGDLYEVTLPASGGCTDDIRFYFEAESTVGEVFVDPLGAPVTTYRATAAFGQQVTLEEDFEGDTSTWTVINDLSLVSGGWEVAVPNGTLSGLGQLAAPPEDAEAATDRVRAFVTENGLPGAPAIANDVDGGPSDLLSPVINLANTDAKITYSFWAFSDDDDLLEVSVTNDGQNWAVVDTAGPNDNHWQVNSFRVGDFVQPTADVQVRFRVADEPNNSLTEAAMDVFRVESFICQAPAAGRVPDGFSIAGPPLRLDRFGPNGILFSWGNSCSPSDTDYAIYEGTLGDFTSHVPRTCSTGGLTEHDLIPNFFGTYFLVVPSDGSSEGSYGLDSAGTPRSASATACLPAAVEIGCGQ